MAWVNSKEQHMREQFIARERLNRLRLGIIECYRKEGVNHYTNCKDLTTKYAKLIRKHRSGMLTPGGPAAEGDDDDDEE